MLVDVSGDGEWGDCRDNNQATLFAFLQAELDLAAIFYTMAVSHASAERRARLIDKVRKALGSVRSFEKDLTDPAQREEIQRSGCMSNER